MNSLKLLKLPFWNIIKNKNYITKLSKYGNTFTNFDKEICRVNKWNRLGEQLYINAFLGDDYTINTDVVLQWKNNRHYANDVSVSNNDYYFAWNKLDIALMDSLNKKTKIDYNNYLNNYIFLHRDISYHASASLLFYSEESPMILLLANSSNDILPINFESFLIPPGLGLNINPFIWHSLPILPYYDKKHIVNVKQYKKPDRIYYNSIVKHNTLFCIKILI